MYTHGVTNNTRRKNKKENSLTKFGLSLKNSATRYKQRTARIIPLY